jgi:GH43 family beta-xylosidase
VNELIDIANSRQNGADYFVSPYRQISHIGDPFVLYDEASGKYYMYCTGGKFRCWSSDTFKSWTEHGDAYTVTEKSFGTQNYWAPEVYKWNGAYYMVYSAARKVEGSLSSTGLRHSIGLAKADNPAGPFTDVYDHPLFAPDYSVIDASLLFDDDGKIYLYYARDCSENVVDGKKTSQVYGIELASDLSGTVGEPVLLATPTSAWELKSGGTLWNEGPCVFKKNGTYYLLFTANYYASAAYSVGYATASSPLGTYTKAAENPILIGDGKKTSGTGHCSVTRSPDGSELYLVYHSHADVTQTTNPVANRTPCFDKLVVRPDGSLAVSGPSVYMQPIPSGANGLYKKYSGVKITSSYPTLNGSAENLLDGVVTSKLGDADLYRFEVTADGCITLEFDSAVELSALWIWGTEHVTLSPKSVSAVLDDTYRLRAKNFSAIEGQTPVVLTCGNLPAGTQTKTVKLYFEAASAASGTATLCEIVVVAGQQK